MFYLVRGRTYYEEPQYQTWLISRERRELFPTERILSQINWNNVNDFLDFGMGHGYFTPSILKKIGKNGWLWGAECQEKIIDLVLKEKHNKDWQNFTSFYIERTEHPLIPDWVPDPEILFCSCVLSSFADPSLAIAGIGRKLKNDGLMYILDWEKLESKHPPEIHFKMSKNRMIYCIEEAGYEVSQELQTNSWLYFLEIKKTQKAKNEKNQFAYLDY